MTKKNQSKRLTNQHKESKGVVGIFGDEALATMNKQAMLSINKASLFTTRFCQHRIKQKMFVYAFDRIVSTTICYFVAICCVGNIVSTRKCFGFKKKLLTE